MRCKLEKSISFDKYLLKLKKEMEEYSEKHRRNFENF